MHGPPSDAASQHPPPEPPPSPRDAEAPPASGDPSSHGVTELLLAWGAGDREALDALLPLLYADLRRQARRALRREQAGHTLQATALVHEAFLRLVDQRGMHWESRTQFLAVAARAMRRILVDHARTRLAAKRGGGARQVTLSGVDVASGEGAGIDAPGGVDVLALDEALGRLAEIDPDKARLVELRYFAGMSIPEAAAALGVSQATVGRQWAVARLWLRRELEG
jgi:RNA polymerase sigma-70 factor (ECF subfamily)